MTYQLPDAPPPPLLPPLNPSKSELLLELLLELELELLRSLSLSLEPLPSRPVAAGVLRAPPVA
jgi:hypothetical protein